ncbi:MAG: TetR/AcrR family transcriptional regulator [Pseudomonadota bacterium]
MARPRTFSEKDTLKRILDAFWHGGYAGTSLADIMAATGLQKGSLYAAFGDKPALYRAALDLYDTAEVEDSVELLKSRSGLEAIQALLAGPAEAVRSGDRRGCFLCNALQDPGLEDAVTLARRDAMLRRFRGAIAAAIQRGGAASARIPDADAILALYAGLRTLARAGYSANRLDQIAKAAV